MKLSVKQFNKFILKELPSAYLCGVKLEKLNNQECISKVKFKWINKNPFKSIYFAVLGMAAELSTGAPVLQLIKESNHSFSSLIVGMDAQFLKKAVGTVRFTCTEIININKYIDTAAITKKGVSFNLKSIGIDEQGDEVAVFNFSWSVKIRE